MNTWGEKIVELLRNSQNEVLIVAPFMRSDALSRLLDNVPEGPQVTIVTRWLIADLVSGASDLDVYDVARSRNSTLLLRSDLHAKYFAADDSCLVGSANVTATALGWRQPSNLELLASLPRKGELISDFERDLLSNAIRATIEQRDHLKQLMDSLASEIKFQIVASLVDGHIPGSLPTNWVPKTMNPEELYAVYCGRNRGLGRRMLSAMEEELAPFSMVSGLAEDDFRSWIASAIAQTPLVVNVLKNVDAHGQVTESSLRRLLLELGLEPENISPRDVLKVLERWLTYFLPDRYETTRDSIKLIRAKRL